MNRASGNVWRYVDGINVCDGDPGSCVCLKRLGVAV